MTRKATLLLLLLGLCTTLALAATVTFFQTSYDGTNVRVEWELANEAGVQGFEIYRKASSESTYSRLSAISPNGQRRYQYVDANVYRGTPGAGGGPFTYRLLVRTSTGDQSYTTVLSQTPSAVQRSWGSIKSMFR
ncbi:hypothetical protein LJY25_10230 [Hymenobacter sp. BT175]|uniref:hypothetical protein n=1 Tax=Hymenobacter translucens TaxID=2886507 RepID=UPI001D0E0254|nr:hypothetical protein [Hymenobacter translucens]MCC2546821.1 hypothetical protein [Hymenobacter translucens]